MEAPFTSSQHERVFRSVLSQLQGLGYRGELLQERYTFDDWFQPESPMRCVPAAAFGRVPPSYDAACFAVLLPNGVAGRELVTRHRALGAPVAIEVGEGEIAVWKVGRDSAATNVRFTFAPDQLANVFSNHAQDWSAAAILRAKNIGLDLGPRQLDFYDLGLIPALEEQIRDKLHRLLQDVLAVASRAYKSANGSAPDERELFRMVFQFLAAKILHDRGADGFVDIAASSRASDVLALTSRYYSHGQPALTDASAQDAAFRTIWGRVSFNNLSVETLAYIYENTLVSEPSRRELGTHSTPSSIARYLVHHLPFESFPSEERFVVEPCSGHGILLVAAMQRLRDLLPASLPADARHRYFVQMLRGFELDAFALEVGKLCLMLADFPHPNGWRLENDDVFASPSFDAALQEARIVLCNPPFGDFSDEERAAYGTLTSIRKPAELLHRVLANLHRDGVVGFVLPRHFIDGVGYRELRESLARRFAELQVVALPDRVFQVSKAESALLIASAPRAAGGKTSVAFTEVADADRAGFLREYAFTRRDRQPRTAADVAKSLAIPRLADVWKHLENSTTVGDLAEVHRGIEWKKFDESTCYSTTPKPGFRAGFARVRRSLYSYINPSIEYLNVDPNNLLWKAIDWPWDRPKVVLNAARLSRGSWRLAAFPDFGGNICSQRFHGLWPIDRSMSPEYLAAVLNGPIANAYMSTHERARDNHISVLASIPVPSLTEKERSEVTQLVGSYISSATTADASEPLPSEILLRIDALVLRGYGLPPRLERRLLSSFDGQPRPVPFPFAGYDFDLFALYRIGDGPGDYRAQWDVKRARREELLVASRERRLSEGEEQELKRIEDDVDRYMDTVDPLPFHVIDDLKRLLRADGTAIDDDE